MVNVVRVSTYQCSPQIKSSKNLQTGSVNVYYTCKEFYSISRLEKTNIRSERATSTDGEMSSCLSCIAFKPSSQPPADYQTCMNKVESGGGL